MRKLTIAICSRNRAQSLRRTLASIADAERPKRCDLEVLVVLNDCSDDSAAVVDAFAAKLPIRRSAEPRPGVSFARNRVLDEAAGDFILWTDDDVVVGRDWTRIYEDAAVAWPATTFFAGPILPHLEEPVPRWLPAVLPILGSVFGRLTLNGVQDCELISGPQLPYGANFGVRADVHRRYRFDTALGRIPAKRIRNGEETSVVKALLADRHEGRWLMAAPVEHVIPTERQNLRHIRSYYVGNGIHWGLDARRPAPAQRMAELAVDSLWVAGSELRYHVTRQYSPPRRWARHLRAASIARGKWLGKYRPNPFGLS